MPPPMSYQPLDRLFWKFLEKVAQDWNKNPYVKVDRIEDYINLNEYRQILLDVEPDAPTEINSSELMIKIPQRNSYSRSGRSSEIYSKRRARKRRAKFEVSVISEKKSKAANIRHVLLDNERLLLNSVPSTVDETSVSSHEKSAVTHRSNEEKRL